MLSTLSPRLLLALLRLPDSVAERLAPGPQEVDGQPLGLRTRLLLRLIRFDRSDRHKRPVEVQRQSIDFMAMRASGTPRPAQVQALEVPGPAGPRPARLYTPISGEGQGGQGPRPGLLYLHGGGFVVGNLDSHDSLCRRLAQSVGCGVLALDYRLAPEHVFPAALEDSVAALAWLGEHAAALGLDPTRLAVGGDSAGGNLALAAARQLGSAGGAPLRAALLIYPALDMRCDTPSMRTFARGYYLSADHVRWFRDTYLGDTDTPLEDPRLSPGLMPTLEGLPPVVLVTAGLDPLRDEGRAFAERLAGSGRPHTHLELPGLVHGFLNLCGVIPEADAGIERICAALQERL